MILKSLSLNKLQNQTRRISSTLNSNNDTLIQINLNNNKSEMVKSNTITESIHKPAIRSKLVLPAILISDTTSTLTSNPANKSMKQSRTCPEIDKNNNSILGVEYEGDKTGDEPMLENVHELMLPATAASISKLRSNSFKNRVKQTRRPSSLFPLRPPTTPSPLEAMIACSSNGKPPTPTTIMLNIGGKSMRSSIKSIKSIKSVRINPDSSKEVDQHKSSNVEDSTSPTKVNDVDDADELRSFRTLQSNKSSILRRSYSHKSNNSSKSHGSSRSRTNKHSRSSKYASKNGMDDQYEDEDEEMIVSQIKNVILIG